MPAKKSACNYIASATNVMVLAFGLYFTSYSFCAGNERSVNKNRQFEYAIKLYLEDDYYRSITEILRLKLRFPEESAKHQLDLYLLKNYYHLKDFAQVKLIAEGILPNPAYALNKDAVGEVTTYLTLSLLEEGENDKAEQLWNKFANLTSSDLLPPEQDIPGQVNPDKAKLYSKIVPGSGLLLSREYSKATVSFVINIVFLVGSYNHFVLKQYGIAGLMFFFEIGWYFGGQNAAHEAAVKYNKTIISQYRQQWLNSQKD